MKSVKDKVKSEVYIRSDGWVFTEEGMNRLKAGGMKGFNRFKANIEAKIGKWHRVLKPLDAEAAEAVMQVKGMVPRAMFIASAILAEAERRAKNPPPPLKEKSCVKRGKFMRLTLTADAYWTIRPMENALFREFVSTAISRAVQRQKPRSV